MIRFVSKLIERFIAWNPPLSYFLVLLLLAIPYLLVFVNEHYSIIQRFTVLQTEQIKKSSHGPYSYSFNSSKTLRPSTKLFEADTILPAPDSLHDDIGNLGAGRYSVWGNTIYFSSSDNSDPRTNGKTYKTYTTASVSLFIKRCLLTLALLCFFLFLLKLNKLAYACMKTKLGQCIANLTSLYWQMKPSFWYFAILVLLGLPATFVYINEKAALITEYKVFGKEISPSSGHGQFAYIVNFTGSVPFQNSLILEDGKALPIPNSIHSEIGTKGMGRYSVWGRLVYFSSSDNSDPRTNGKEYKIEVPRQSPLAFKMFFDSLLLVALTLFIFKIKYFLDKISSSFLIKHSIVSVALLSVLLHFIFLFSTPLIFFPDTASYMDGTITLLHEGSLHGVASFRTPGLAILYAPIMFLFKSMALWPIKVFIHLLAIACNITTAAVALELTGKRWIALLSGLLCLIWLDAFHYSSCVSSEIPSALFVLLFTLFLIRAIRTGGKFNYFMTAIMASAAALIRSENILLFIPFVVFTIIMPIWDFFNARRAESIRTITVVIIASFLGLLPLLGWATYNWQRAGFFGLTSYGVIAFHDSALVSGITLKQDFAYDGSPSVQLIRKAVTSYSEYCAKNNRETINGAFYNTWYDTDALRYHITGTPLQEKDKSLDRPVSRQIDTILQRANLESIATNPDKYLAMQVSKFISTLKAVRNLYIPVFNPEQTNLLCTWNTYPNYFNCESDKISPFAHKIFKIFFAFKDFFLAIIFILFLVAIPGFIICLAERPLLPWWAFLSVTFYKTFFVLFMGHPSPRVIFQGSYLYIILGICTIAAIVSLLVLIIKKAAKSKRNDWI